MSLSVSERIESLALGRTPFAKRNRSQGVGTGAPGHMLISHVSHGSLHLLQWGRVVRGASAHEEDSLVGARVHLMR